LDHNNRNRKFLISPSETDFASLRNFQFSMNVQIY